MEYAHAALPAVPLFQDLYLCTAGKSVCCPDHGFGPDVRLNYLIHCVLSGKGCFETDEKQYSLCQGQGFLIEPGLATRYCADSQQPWSYFWIGFNGTLAPKIVKALGLGHQPVLPVRFISKNHGAYPSGIYFQLLFGTRQGNADHHQRPGGRNRLRLRLFKR